MCEAGAKDGDAAKPMLAALVTARCRFGWLRRRSGVQIGMILGLHKYGEPIERRIPKLAHPFEATRVRSLLAFGHDFLMIYAMACHAFALAGSVATSRLRGSASAAMAAASESPPDTAIAIAKPTLKARSPTKLPAAANAVTARAMPKVPPRKRAVLKMPDALPTSLGATAPNTALWAAGMATETPAPASTRGGMILTKARSGRATTLTQANPAACINNPPTTNGRSPSWLTSAPPTGAKTNSVAVQGSNLRAALSGSRPCPV